MAQEATRLPEGEMPREPAAVYPSAPSPNAGYQQPPMAYNWMYMPQMYQQQFLQWQMQMQEAAAAYNPYMAAGGVPVDGIPPEGEPGFAQAQAAAKGKQQGGQGTTYAAVVSGMSDMQLGDQQQPQQQRGSAQKGRKAKQQRAKQGQVDDGQQQDQQQQAEAEADNQSEQASPESKQDESVDEAAQVQEQQQQHVEKLLQPAEDEEQGSPERSQDAQDQQQSDNQQASASKNRKYARRQNKRRQPPQQQRPGQPINYSNRDRPNQWMGQQQYRPNYQQQRHQQMQYNGYQGERYRDQNMQSMRRSRRMPIYEREEHKQLRAFLRALIHTPAIDNRRMIPSPTPAGAMPVLLPTNPAQMPYGAIPQHLMDQSVPPQVAGDNQVADQEDIEEHVKQQQLEEEKNKETLNTLVKLSYGGPVQKDIWAPDSAAQSSFAAPSSRAQKAAVNPAAGSSV